MVVLDNENGRVILQFAADVSLLRTPMALVLDMPTKPISLEDEQGMIVTFTRPVNDEEFLAIALAGEISVAPVDNSTGKVINSYNVIVMSKITFVDN